LFRQHDLVREDDKAIFAICARGNLVEDLEAHYFAYEKAAKVVA
jgi:hypothetical protein